MKPIDFPGREAILGAPQGWDEAKHGPCEGLPIIRQDGACVSLWEATPEERDAIAAGANIWLHVHSGHTQPPVGLAVGRPPNRATYEAPRDPTVAVRVRGVGRIGAEPRALLLMLTEQPTDDELRALHEFFSQRPMLEAIDAALKPPLPRSGERGGAVDRAGGEGVADDRASHPHLTSPSSERVRSASRAVEGEEHESHDFGPCCICETRTGVTNIIMLDRRAPVPGKGWGCVVCDLPSDGAVAVVCNGCLELVSAGANPALVCEGYAGEGRRVPFASLPAEPFAHIAERHQDDEP